MIPILLITTTLFWFFVIIQSSFFETFFPDLPLLLIFVWSLYVLSKGDNIRVGILFFLTPIFFGMGLASSFFYRLIFLVPYLAFVLMQVYLIFVKKKWSLRPKESFLFMALSFFVFILFYLIIKKVFSGYDISYYFWSRMVLTYFLCLLFWFIFILKRSSNKIR